MPRGDGPFKVIENVNNNAQKLELPADMGMSPTFNIGDLTPYLKDEDDGDNLRANHNQAREEVAHFSPRELTSPSQYSKASSQWTQSMH